MRRLIVLFFGLIGLISLIGCKTTKEVLRVEKRDTMVVWRADTVRLWKTQIQWRDSIVRDSIVIERDTMGRIVYKEVVRNRELRLHDRDTVIMYQSKRDSSVRSSEATTVKEKRPPRKRKAGWPIIVIVVFMVGAGIILYRKERK